MHTPRWQCLHRSIGLLCAYMSLADCGILHHKTQSTLTTPPVSHLRTKNYRELVGQNLWGLSSKEKAPS